MKWENNRRSSNIEDRRGESQSFGGSSRGSSIVSLLPLIKSLLGTKIGRIILIIGLVLYFGFGINPLSFIEGEATSQTQTKKVVNQEYDDRQAAFVSAVLAQTEDIWREVLAKNGLAYIVMLNLYFLEGQLKVLVDLRLLQLDLFIVQVIKKYI